MEREEDPGDEEADETSAPPYERAPYEEEGTRAFPSEYFPERVLSEPPTGDDLSEEEVAGARLVAAYLDERFDRMKYILGLALDFVLLSPARLQRRRLRPEPHRREPLRQVRARGALRWAQAQHPDLA